MTLCCPLSRTWTKRRGRKKGNLTKRLKRDKMLLSQISVCILFSFALTFSLSFLPRLYTVSFADLMEGIGRDSTASSATAVDELKKRLTDSKKKGRGKGAISNAPLPVPLAKQTKQRVAREVPFCFCFFIFFIFPFFLSFSFLFLFFSFFFLFVDYLLGRFQTSKIRCLKMGCCC